MTVNDTIAVRVLEPGGRRRRRAGRSAHRPHQRRLSDGRERTLAGGDHPRDDLELSELIAAGEIVVAARDGQLIGVVHVHDVADDTSEFGMLAAAPEQRGVGVGRALLDFAEERSRQRGRRAMQLELLVPRSWRHPSKEFLRSWYGHRGYRLSRTTTLDEAYPHLAPLLATPCDLEIHAKPL